MKLIVAGSRTVGYTVSDDEMLENVGDQQLVNYTLHEFREKNGIEEIVCGGAYGADELGNLWAIDNNVPVRKFLPNWKKFGNSAGILRNKEMAEYADQAIVFWNGQSRGSKHMIEEMKKLNKPVTVIIVPISEKSIEDIVD